LEEAEKRKKLEEAERVYEAHLQEEERWKEKGEQNVTKAVEDDEEMEKELSGSNKKVSDYIL
jgi:hypothetical protein